MVTPQYLFLVIFVNAILINYANAMEHSTGHVIHPAFQTPSEDKTPDTEHTLFQAIRDNDFNRVKECLLINPDFIYTTDQDGNTPLHLAVLFDFSAIAEFIILTIIKQAKWQGLSGIVITMKIKTMLSSKNNLGKTPLELAPRANTTASIILYEANEWKYRGAIPRFFFIHVTNSQILWVKMDLAYKPELAHVTDFLGRTPLHTCAEILYENRHIINARAEIAQALIDSVAKQAQARREDQEAAITSYVNTPDKYKSTALHVAASFNFGALALKLIQNYADRSALNCQNKTPKDLAEKYNAQYVLPLL